MSSTVTQLSKWELRRTTRRRHFKWIALGVGLAAFVVLPWSFAYFMYRSEDADAKLLSLLATQESANVLPSKNPQSKPVLGIVISKPIFELKESILRPEEAIICIPVRIQDREYLFCIDTGSSRTRVNSAIAAKLKPMPTLSRALAASGRTMDELCYLAPDIVLNGHVLRNTQQTVYNIECIGVSVGPTRYAGILGMDILSNYVMQLNSETSKFTMCGSVKDLKDFDDSYRGYDIVQKDNVPYIHIEMFDVPDAFVLLDTGGMDLCGVDEEMLAAIPHQALPSTMMDSSGAILPSYSVHKSWSFQNCQINDLIVNCMHTNSLGLPFMAKFNVTFDFPHKRVYFKRLKDGSTF